MCERESVFERMRESESYRETERQTDRGRVRENERGREKWFLFILSSPDRRSALLPGRRYAP